MGFSPLHNDFVLTLLYCMLNPWFRAENSQRLYGIVWFHGCKEINTASDVNMLMMLPVGQQRDNVLVPYYCMLKHIEQNEENSKKNKK